MCNSGKNGNRTIERSHFCGRSLATLWRFAAKTAIPFASSTLRQCRRHLTATTSHIGRIGNRRPVPPASRRLVSASAGHTTLAWSPFFRQNRQPPPQCRSWPGLQATRSMRRPFKAASTHIPAKTATAYRTNTQNANSGKNGNSIRFLGWSAHTSLPRCCAINFRQKRQPPQPHFDPTSWEGISKLAFASGRICSYRGWTYNNGRRKHQIVHTGFVSSEGQQVEITNLIAFCRKHGLHPVHMRQLKNGQRKSHKGWTWRATNEQPAP